MLTLIVAAFGVVQSLLTLRLILPMFGWPEQFESLFPLFIQVTDLLMAPFRTFGLPGGDAFPMFGTGQMDTSVLPALIGWSIVELVVVGALRLLGAGRPRTDTGSGWDGA